jgi:hypothetical protein
MSVLHASRKTLFAATGLTAQILQPTLFLTPQAACKFQLRRCCGPGSGCKLANVNNCSGGWGRLPAS